MPEESSPKSADQQFADAAARAGLKISAEDAGSLSGWISSAHAAFAAVRELDVNGHEPATVFIPIRSPGTRRQESD